MKATDDRPEAYQGLHVTARLGVFRYPPPVKPVEYLAVGLLRDDKAVYLDREQCLELREAIDGFFGPADKGEGAALQALKALLWQHDNNGGQLCGMALQDARAAVAAAEGKV